MINYVQHKKIDEKRIMDLLSDSIEVNQFTNNGPVKKKLEKLLHHKLNLPDNKSVVCLSNGTTACHALMFLFQRKFNKKIKWAIPAFTFPTPVIGGFDCKILDIDHNTYTIKLCDESLKKVDGIIVTNLFGTCSNIEELELYAKENNKILLFDNASSPLTNFKNKNICAYGNASFGSLHHTKFLGFGEGGFVVVPSEDYDSINQIANFGFTSQRIHHKLSSNYKISEISSAYCYSQIESYDLAQHKKNQNYLIENLKNFDIEIFNIDNENCEYVLGNLPILFDRSIEISEFRNLGLEANKYYRPLSNLKNSNKLFSKIINLPLHNGLSQYQIDLMIQICCEIKKKKA